MIIEEYTQLTLSAPDTAPGQSVTHRTVTKIVDGLIVIAYILSLIGIMPFLVTFAWAKENWISRDVA